MKSDSACDENYYAKNKKKECNKSERLLIAILSIRHTIQGKRKKEREESEMDLVQMYRQSRKRCVVCLFVCKYIKKK